MQPESMFLEHGTLSLTQVKKKTFEAKAELCINSGSGEVCPEKTEATVQMGKVKERGSQKSAPELGGGVRAWARVSVRTGATCCNSDELIKQCSPDKLKTPVT